MKNRVAIITGAASGIGLALTKACLQSKMHVIMADSQNILFERARELKALANTEILPILCDVSNSEEVRELYNQTIENFSHVDLLINNAGISGSLAPFWELGLNDVKKVLDVNLYGIINCLHYFLPFMIAQPQKSHIVNMASVYGLCSGSLLSAYSMSKHAVLALSESLYFDLKRLNKPVSVSVICPAFVNTNLLKNSHTNSFENKVSKENKIAEKMQRLIEYSSSAEDIAAYILQEVDKESFYILPDKEVKNYCQQRTEALINECEPFKHSLEKIIGSICK